MIQDSLYSASSALLFGAKHDRNGCDGYFVGGSAHRMDEAPHPIEPFTGAPEGLLSLLGGPKGSGSLHSAQPAGTYHGDVR